jgi:hypothetical protein
MTSTRFNALLGLAVGLPAAVLIIVCGVSGVKALAVGRPVIFATVPTSMAEAAGNRDVADMVRRGEAGEPPDARTIARIPLRLHSPAALTPLEAAVIAERPYLITLARTLGATLDAETLTRLRCIARARKDRGTIAYLDRLDSSPLRCDRVPIPY